MDAHQLAIAALNESQSSHRRDPTAVAIPHQNATGSYSMNNAIVKTTTESQDSLGEASGTAEVALNGEGSQDSHYSMLQSTSSNHSQSTTDEQDAATPPTSTSDGFSSQSTNQDGQLSQLSQLSQIAAAQQPMKNTSAARQSLPNGPTAGHKRTADGQVKPPSPPSPHASVARGHSRNTSTVSNVSSVASSRIGEVNKDLHFPGNNPNLLQLSSELRTRLSYAMVKVNNGWQSNTIDEVESLASQAGSPTSSTSTLHGRRHPITSPRAAIASVQNRDDIPINTIIQTPTTDFDLYSRGEPAQLTYESFWRGHSTAIPPPRSSHVTSPSSSKAGLAPPADIRPHPSSRRSHTPKFSRPPTIPGQGSNSSHTSMPRTPNRGDYNMESKSLQTPTQKTIQEQDAIETLLFMSSPGNSGNMGHQFPGSRTNQGSPQNSPLRAEFNVQDRARGALGRRVGLGKGPTSGVSSTGEQSYTQRNNALNNSKSRGDAIDKMLDEMGDSSSDEEDLTLNYSSPRRVAAGRV